MTDLPQISDSLDARLPIYCLTSGRSWARSTTSNFVLVNARSPSYPLPLSFNLLLYTRSYFNKVCAP